MSLEVSYDHQVATITLARPEVRNALSTQMCADIASALIEIDASSARAVLLRGAGGVFCAGADFAAISGPGGLEFLPVFEGMLNALWRFRLPTVACLTRAALGGGLQLATACDFRVAGDDCKIGIPSSRLGVVINLENVERLTLLAGVRVAKEVLMTGKVFTGADAFAAGLVTEVHPSEDAEAAATDLARRLSELSPLSVQGAKSAVNLVADDLSSARARHSDRAGEIDALVAEAYRSRDLQEGVAAMKEKRPPSFEGS